MDEEIEPDKLCSMKTPKVIEETFLRTMKQVWIWKNRINDIVLCISVPIDWKWQIQAPTASNL